MEIGLPDHIVAVPKRDFSSAWEAFGEENEYDETFALSSIATLEDAVAKLQQYLGMAPCEHSDRIPEGKSQHALLLSGVYRGGYEVLARIRLALDRSDQSVNMNITVR